MRTLHHDEEILNLEERLTSTVSDDPSRPELLFRLANALHTRFIRSKRPLEHDPAVDRLREALSLPQTTRSLYCIISNTLGSWLAKQARLAGNHLPMEEAIRIQRANLDRHKLDSPEYESALDGLSKVLHWSFILDEDRGKVEEAVRLQRERLKIRENEDNEEGITACLDSISTQLKSLLHVSPSDDPDRTQILADVGKVLWYQYRVSEDVMVLREAIDMEEQVLERLPTRHPNRPYALSQLRRWMAQYAMLTDGWTILDRAIDLGREAVKLCPSGHAHHANAMRELAVSLQAQADMTEEFAPLEEAILMLRGYLAVTPSSDVLGLDGGTGALVSALVLLSKMTKTPKHLEEAIQLEQGDKLGTGITKLRHDLSKLYIEQYQAEHKLELLEKAIQVEADAIHDSSVTAYVRVADIHASLSLVHYYALRLTPVESRARLLPRLLEVYAQALGLLPAVVDYGITNPSSSLAALRGLDDVGQASSALACALGQPARAVELLERARAVFWAQALRLRAPLDSLPLEDAEHLAEVFGEIELGSHRARNPELPEWADPEMDRLGALQMDATQLIEGVRERPGFEGFLMNRLIAELSMAAEKAPVVVLLAHEDACEALLITRPGVEIERVSLAKMPVTKLVRLAERVKATNLRARSMADASAQPEDDGEQERKAKVHKEVGESEQTLRAIWQEIVYPIILHLGLQVSMYSLGFIIKRLTYADVETVRSQSTQTLLVPHWPLRLSSTSRRRGRRAPYLVLRLHSAFLHLNRNGASDCSAPSSTCQPRRTPCSPRRRVFCTWPCLSSLRKGRSP